MALNNGLDNDQASTRRPATLYDQHVSTKYPKGRPWHADVDKKSGFPVGLVRPKGWRAPWLPEQTFFKYDADEPNRFAIDYDAILNERIQALTEYQQEYDSKAVSKGWDPSDETKRDNIEKVVGKRPLPIEPVLAAKQGNAFILGLTEKVDPRLEPFVRKETTRDRILKALPDFSDEPFGASGILEDQEVETEDEELNRLLDLEEDVDAEAVGGKRVPVKSNKKPSKAA
jgi:hypothetical protein